MEICYHAYLTGLITSSLLHSLLFFLLVSVVTAPDTTSTVATAATVATFATIATTKRLMRKMALEEKQLSSF